MSNLVKPLLAIVVLGVIFAASLVIYTLPHWWVRVATVEARTSYGSLYAVPVYKSIKGDLLFEVTADSLRAEYIFDRETRRIGMPSVSQIHVLPFIAYSNEAPVSVVWSDDKSKVETDMNIIIDENRIEFTTHWGWRIIADRNNF